MWPFDPPADRAPSVLWMWGFWACAAAALAAFVLSLYASPPGERLLRSVAGVLFLIGGAHQGHVVAYKVATRGAYSTFGPNAYLLQRQMGWSAMVLGAVLIASGAVDM